MVGSLIYINRAESFSIAYDHTWLNTPVLVRSLKLSNHEPG